MTEVTSPESAPALDLDLHKIDIDKMLQMFWDERPRLREEYSKFIAHTSPLIKKSMLLAYMAGADDTMKYISKNIKRGGFSP